MAGTIAASFSATVSWPVAGGLTKEQVAVDRPEDAGELGLAGDLALAARDIDRELVLPP